MPDSDDLTLITAGFIALKRDILDLHQHVLSLTKVAEPRFERCPYLSILLMLDK